MNPTTATTVTTSATTVTAAAAAPAKDGTKVVCGKVVSEDGQITIFENCVVATEPGQNAIMLPEDEKIHPSALALVNSLKATFAKSK
jgi:predicted NAD/FAD-binding protein